MSGYTKHMYEKDLQETRKQLEEYVDNIIPLLSVEYDFDEILNLVKEYYPYEWRILEEKYQYYCKKDKTIKKFHGKERYSADCPKVILRRLPVVNKLLMPDTIKRKREIFSAQKQKENKIILDKKRLPKIKKQRERIEKAKKRAQEMEPEFLDALMGLYDRKSTSQKDKMYVFLELEKYYCKKMISFFKKVADSEYNCQLRNMAFEHLQSLGHYTFLRKQKYMQIHTKNKKRKQRIKGTAHEIFDIKAIPQELEYRIENSKEQKLKTYDYFVSHSSMDHQSVQKLITFLNKDNKNVYCDWKADDNYLKRNLVCTATKNVINKRIEQSRRIIFVDSVASRNSCWVKYELNYADQQGKEILILSKDSIDSDNICLTTLKDKWFTDSNYESILQL